MRTTRYFRMPIEVLKMKNRATLRKPLHPINFSIFPRDSAHIERKVAPISAFPRLKKIPKVGVTRSPYMLRGTSRAQEDSSRDLIKQIIRTQQGRGSLNKKKTPRLTWPDACTLSLCHFGVLCAWLQVYANGTNLFLPLARLIAGSLIAIRIITKVMSIFNV